MTLDMFAWLAIFAVFAGFLILTAYIAENWPSTDPTDDAQYERRHQAHEAKRWQARKP